MMEAATEEKESVRSLRFRLSHSEGAAEGEVDDEGVVASRFYFMLFLFYVVYTFSLLGDSQYRAQSK